MTPRRRLLGAAALTCLAPSLVHAAARGVSRRALRFPEDFGAHPDTRVEWWYATGWLESERQRHGFQITFFRARTDLPAAGGSRFAATQIVFAHAAMGDVAARRLHHDQRIARAGFGIAETAEGDTAVTLRDWSMRREGAIERSVWHARAASESAGFAFDLSLAATQPLLLQGDAGYSRKGPLPGEASHYYSAPQLSVSGSLAFGGRTRAVRGRAWLDHEWSDSYLDPQAVGWDWVGMNLDDGSALMAFRIRRPDGSALWGGGAFRGPGSAARSFAPEELRFTPGRLWTSAASRARYPVEWTLDTPAGRFGVKALFDAQELDSRASTGGIYWEGLSELLDASGRRVGLGYLEMTGYAGALKLGA